MSYAHTRASTFTFEGESFDQALPLRVAAGRRCRPRSNRLDRQESLRAVRMRRDVKEHRVPNNHGPLGQGRPLTSKPLILFLDQTVMLFPDFCAFRSAVMELLGSALHVNLHRIACGCCSAKKFTNPVMEVTACCVIQPISERFRLDDANRNAESEGKRGCYEQA